MHASYSKMICLQFLNDYSHFPDTLFRLIIRITVPYHCFWVYIFIISNVSIMLFFFYTGNSFMSVYFHLRESDRKSRKSSICCLTLQISATARTWPVHLQVLHIFNSCPSAKQYQAVESEETRTVTGTLILDAGNPNSVLIHCVTISNQVQNF